MLKNVGLVGKLCLFLTLGKWLVCRQAVEVICIASVSSL